MHTIDKALDTTTQILKKKEITFSLKSNLINKFIRPVLISLIVILPYIIILLQNKYFAVGDSSLWFLRPSEFLNDTFFVWLHKVNFGYDVQSSTPFFYWQVLIFVLSVFTLGKAALLFFLIKSITILIGFWGFYHLAKIWQSSSILSLALSFCFVYSLVPFTQMHLGSIFSEQLYYTLPVTIITLYRYIYLPFSKKNLILSLIVLSFDLIYLTTIAFTLGFILPYLLVLLYVFTNTQTRLREYIKRLGILFIYFGIINLWILYGFFKGFVGTYSTATDIINPSLNFIATENYGSSFLGFTGVNLLVLNRSGIELNSLVFYSAIFQVLAVIFCFVLTVRMLQHSRKAVTLGLFASFLVFFVWSAGTNFSLWGIVQSFTTTPNIVISLFRGAEAKLSPTVFISLLLLASFLKLTTKWNWLLSTLLLINPFTVFGLMVFLTTTTFQPPAKYLANDGTAIVAVKPAYFELETFLDKNITSANHILRLPLSTYDYVDDETDTGDYVGADFSRYLYKNPFIFSVKYEQPTDSFVQATYNKIIQGDYNSAFSNLEQHQVSYILIDQNIKLGNLVASVSQYTNAQRDIQSELDKSAEKVFVSKDESITLYHLKDVNTLSNLKSQCIPENYSPEWHLFKWDINYLIQNFGVKPYNDNGFTCFNVPTVSGYIYFDLIVRFILIGVSLVLLVLLIVLNLKKRNRKSFASKKDQLLSVPTEQSETTLTRT